MKRRVLATALWFLAMWYVGAFAAYMLGVSSLLAPILGTAAAAIVAGDPRRLIWSRASARSDRTVAAATGQQAQNLA